MLSILTYFRYDRRNRQFQLDTNAQYRWNFEEVYERRTKI